MSVDDGNRGARNWLLVAAVAGALSVLLGAFGAHALQSVLEPRLLAVYHTAVDYHMAHALLLTLVAIAHGQKHMLHAGCARFAARALVFGLLLFCGSLYALAISGISALGMITPLGGIAFVAGWLSLALAAWRGPESTPVES